MARIPLPFFLAVGVLFISFSLSDARIQANIPTDEVTNSGNLPTSFPESDSDVNSVLRLPSDNESISNEPIKEAQESKPLKKVQPLLLDVVTFRPADRRFRFRSRFPFRCRHHHRFFMPMRQQRQQQYHQEIPYGDDMIVSSRENADFEQRMFHGGARRIPAGRWVKIPHHHHDDNNEDEGNDGISNLMFRHSHLFDNENLKLHKHHRHHHHHHHHDEEDEEDKEERFTEHKEKKEKKGYGFMKRIRKFLDHHF